jgi:hypothetical protein
MEYESLVRMWARHGTSLKRGTVASYGGKLILPQKPERVFGRLYADEISGWTCGKRFLLRRTEIIEAGSEAGAKK